ncbi:MAG: UDP-N-acetylmuramoyl-L-alanyl-D-glutamate--2,6-diaminopimelate ligase [Candidatus Bipolaricaulota bacterium]
MCTLGALAGELGVCLPQGTNGVREVQGLAWDSRRVNPGDLFFALPGRRTDGHAFISEAVSRGAVAVVCQRRVSGLEIPVLRVPDGRSALARAAALFYGHPTSKLRAVGVTGTDGKSTVVHLLGQLLPECQTVTTLSMETERLSCVTTPEAPDLQRLAAQAVNRGRQAFAFEASSIGLAQRRVDGMRLAAAVFTGLGRDHLDYHGSPEAYLAAKLRLFRMLTSEGWVVVGAGDPHYKAVCGAGGGRTVTFGVDAGHLSAENVEPSGGGTMFQLVSPKDRRSVTLPLPGRHNLFNALAAGACAWALGERPADIADRLHRVSLPLGRWTRLRAPRGAEVVVDYAHTPAALELMLKELRPHSRRLLAVFGASGEADRGKRPFMGQAAGRWADAVLITSDNPKSEEPAEIARQIAAGVTAASGEYEVHLDRTAALRRALELAGPGDVVLVAGKGHERCQVTADGPEPYSDLEVLRTLGATLLERLD